MQKKTFETHKIMTMRMINNKNLVLKKSPYEKKEKKKNDP
jgi:hypothetical protein